MSHVITTRQLLRHQLEAARWIKYEEVPIHRYHPDPYLVAIPPTYSGTTITPVTTLISTVSVYGGSGGYTFSLNSNPGGRYVIAGNQIYTALPLVAGIDNIVVQGDNGMGSVVAGTIVVYVTTSPFTPVGGPTYYIYGF